MTIAPIDLGIHTEDPEWDTIDVMDRYAGQALASHGMDGFTEIFDEDGCDILDDDESVNMIANQS